jgi:PAS domain S-box-containing protein
LWREWEGVVMRRRPSYEELEQRVAEIEKEFCTREVSEDLRKSKELFEKTFMSQRDAIFILNAEIPPTVIDCNPAAEKMFGYSRREILGRDTEFLHISKDALGEFQGKLYPSIAEEGFFYLNDFMMKRKDGTLFPSEHTVVPLNNERGERIGWTSVVRDVTGQKQMEKSIRESNERYRLLAENVSDVIFIRDMNLQFTYISPSVEKMTGYSVEEAMGLTMEETYTPRSIELAMEAFSEELIKEKDGQSDPSRVRTIEMEGYRKDGSKIWTEAKTRFLRDSNGRPTGMLGVSRDITERKRAEETLRESEKRYRQLFNHAPAGIYELDFHKQRFIAVNDVMCQYTGYSEEEFLSMSPFDILSDDGKGLYAQRCKNLMAGENISESVEYNIKTKGGEVLWVALNINPVYESGKVKGASVVVHNVTERRKVEQKLRESEERLRSLSSELMKAQEKERTRISKQLHDELGQSLAILKHRVRSIGKKVLACQPQMSHDSEATVEQVDEIIEKVRQISRELNPSILEDVGLCSAIRSLVDNFIREYEIPASLELDEIDDLFARETSRNLYRIFQEALTNIAKHATANHVNLQITKGPEYVQFLIEDDGKGFAANEARIREKKREGLGLALMEERADLVGGTLEIRSGEGAGGTKILLTVPIEKGGC